MKSTILLALFIISAPLTAGGETIVYSPFIGHGAQPAGSMSQDDFITMMIKRVNESGQFEEKFKEAGSISRDTVPSGSLYVPPAEEIAATCYSLLKQDWVSTAQKQLKEEVPGLEFGDDGSIRCTSRLGLSDQAKFACAAKIIDGWRQLLKE